jgi:hypothetical protein
MMTHISGMDSRSIGGHCRSHVGNHRVVVGLKSIYVFTLGENAANCEKLTRMKGARIGPNKNKNCEGGFGRALGNYIPLVAEFVSQSGLNDGRSEVLT